MQVDHPLLKTPPARRVVSVPGQCFSSYVEVCFSEPTCSLVFLLPPLELRSQHRKMSETVCYRSCNDFWLWVFNKPNLVCSEVAMTWGGQIPYLFGMGINCSFLRMWEGRCHKCGWIWMVRAERISVVIWLSAYLTNEKTEEQRT